MPQLDIYTFWHQFMVLSTMLFVLYSLIAYVSLPVIIRASITRANFRQRLHLLTSTRGASLQTLAAEKSIEIVLKTTFNNLLIRSCRQLIQATTPNQVPLRRPNNVICRSTNLRVTTLPTYVSYAISLLLLERSYCATKY